MARRRDGLSTGYPQAYWWTHDRTTVLRDSDNMFGPPIPLPFDPSLLRLGRDLRARGIEPCALPTDWFRVRRGVWIATVVWQELTPEYQHAARVHAAAMTLTSKVPLAFARASAAAVLVLPRISPWPTRVQILGDPWNGADNGHRHRGSRAGMSRCIGACDRLMSLNGLLITPVARTVVDLARSDRLDNALAAGDQALRREWCSRDEIAEEVAAIPRRARGRKQAQLLFNLVDGAAHTAGESLSRLGMFRLNVPKPILQYPLEDADGAFGFADFGWRIGADLIIGEFDGKVKYAVDPELGPKAAQEALWREKQREDRIRRQAAVVRWGMKEATDLRLLAQRLAERGILPTAHNTWFDPPAHPE